MMTKSKTFSSKLSGRPAPWRMIEPLNPGRYNYHRVNLDHLDAASKKVRSNGLTVIIKLANDVVVGGMGKDDL
jgi:hypothetical protein